MAEGQGFEPWVPYDTPVFKTGAFNHSATPPAGGHYTFGDKAGKEESIYSARQQPLRDVGRIKFHDDFAIWRR